MTLRRSAIHLAIKLRERVAERQDMTAYDDWIGRVEVAEDAVSLRDARRMAALLDTDRAPDVIEDGAPLPPLWHWLAFAPIVGMGGLGRDGHPAPGGFLPPVTLERRMWAGGRVQFGAALRIGEVLTRRSEIVKIAEKVGSAGPMVFVTVAHRVTGAAGEVSEAQDIVYVAMPDRFSPPPPVQVAERAWEQPFAATPTRLFRYSALTFNGHRIHYDLPYAQQVEKYPGLVVHGPLQATLMMEAARARARARSGLEPAMLKYRGVRPLFPEDDPRVVGWPVADGKQALGVATGTGLMTMQAEIEWRSA